jgi:hypothetical protein
MGFSQWPCNFISTFMSPRLFVINYAEEAQRY